VISDQDLLLTGFANHTINKEWKEKPGEVYGVIASKTLTGNYHTMSIISSVALLLVTYALALKITGNRMASLLGVMVLDFSRTFLWYNDSIPYPGFYCVLFFMSLYPFKHKIIRPISFLSSFVMKAMSLAFLPITISREKDKRIKIFYIAIGVIASSIAIGLNWVRSSGVNMGNLAPPYVVFEIVLQDFWVIILFLPVCGALFHLWRQKVDWAGTLLGGLLWTLFFQYVLALFTTYGAFSERMLPFIVFFALSISLIISKYNVLVDRLWHKNVPIDS